MPLNDVYSGADGTLVLLPSGTDAESADATAITDLEAFSIAEVGRVTGVDLHVDTDLREFHEIGLRHAASLHQGDIHIWGTIDHAYVNGALLYLLLGRGASPNNVAEPYPQPALAMNLVFQDPAVPGHRSVIDVLGIKLENWAVRMPQDDFVMEKVRFRALRIDVRDQEGTEMRVPSFPAAS
jgi:hypothetical protein